MTCVLHLIIAQGLLVGNISDLLWVLLLSVVQGSKSAGTSHRKDGSQQQDGFGQPDTDPGLGNSPPYIAGTQMNLNLDSIS